MKGVHNYESEADRAWPGDAITVTLEDEVDISRGDLLVHASDQPALGNRFAAHLVWINEQALQPGREYGIKIVTLVTNCSVREVLEEIDVNTLERSPEASGGLALNGIGLCALELAEPVVVEDYLSHPGTGNFILIDKMSNVTVAAGMVERALDGGGAEHERIYMEEERNLNRFVRENFPEWGCKPA